MSIPVITTTTATICSVGAGTTSGSSASATVTMLTGTGTCELKAAWAANYVYKAATKGAHGGSEDCPDGELHGRTSERANGSSFTVTATSNESGSIVSVPTITATPANGVHRERGDEQRTGELSGHGHDQQSHRHLYDEGSVGHELGLRSSLCPATHD